MANIIGGFETGLLDSSLYLLNRTGGFALGDPDGIADPIAHH